MAEEEIHQSEQGGAGDGAGQGAGDSPQGDGQGQGTEQEPVGAPGKGTSSAGQPGRKGNSAWATERIIEKALTKHSQKLEQTLATFVERLSPPAPKSAPANDELGEPDYNNLNGWLNKKFEQLFQKRLSEELPNIQTRFESKLKGVTKTQEARNYLLSQEDIGSDENKLAEVAQIMERERLGIIAESDPLWAVQKAIKLYREAHRNPNAPTKGQLSTASGGAGTQFKKEASIDQIRALQTKLAGNPSQEQLEKITAEIDALMATA